MARFSGDMARTFVYSLIHIALVYDIAHFLSLLLIQGQLIIRLASDPFSKGWDLFGTSDYVPDIGIINARVLWFLSVGVIVLGHIIAVYLAHNISMRLFKNSGLAPEGQFPMLLLMVLYTVVSLWIIAQPIVDCQRIPGHKGLCHLAVDNHGVGLARLEIAAEIQVVLHHPVDGRAHQGLLGLKIEYVHPDGVTVPLPG